MKSKLLIGWLIDFRFTRFCFVGLLISEVVI